MKERFLTQPYLLSDRPGERMYILWFQLQPLGGWVEYGNTADMGCRVEACCYPVTGFHAPATARGYAPKREDNPPITIWQCCAELSVQPGQKIYYRCGSGSVTTETFDFHTAPPAGQPYTFIQLSDLQGLNPCEVAVYQAGLQHPDFILYSGDAVSESWRLDQWFDLEQPWQSRESAKRAFFPCLQQQNGARLWQYAPMFPCPGNHDIDDLQTTKDPARYVRDENWNWSIYMQIFRPLYPDADTSVTGRRWYSVDYSDLHLISLSVQRWCTWDAWTKPGWRVLDAITPDSPQMRWLRQDLSLCRGKYRWVILHWHLLNQGEDVQPNLCDPVLENGTISYPNDYGGDLMELFADGGVHGVTYGHSHVYERYFTAGTHYIEAAHFANCYRQENAPLHPSGLLPVFEDLSQRSYLTVYRDARGLYGIGRYTADGTVFDRFSIADAAGRPVQP